MRLSGVRGRTCRTGAARSAGDTQDQLARRRAPLHQQVGVGGVRQRDTGPKRFNRLRREEFEARFPGLLDLLLRADDV